MTAPVVPPSGANLGGPEAAPSPAAPEAPPQNRPEPPPPPDPEAEFINSPEAAAAVEDAIAKSGPEAGLEVLSDADKAWQQASTHPEGVDAGLRAQDKKGPEPEIIEEDDTSDESSTTVSKNNTPDKARAEREAAAKIFTEKVGREPTEIELDAKLIADGKRAPNTVEEFMQSDSSRNSSHGERIYFAESNIYSLTQMSESLKALGGDNPQVQKLIDETQKARSEWIRFRAKTAVDMNRESKAKNPKTGEVLTDEMKLEYAQGQINELNSIIKDGWRMRFKRALKLKSGEITASETEIADALTERTQWQEYVNEKKGRRILTRIVKAILGVAMIGGLSGTNRTLDNLSKQSQ